MPVADAPKRGAARRRPRKKPTATQVKSSQAQARGYASQGRQIQHAAQRANRAQARKPAVHGHLGLGTSPKHIRTLNVKKHLEGVARQQRAKESERQYEHSGYTSSAKKKGPKLISAAGIGGGLDKLLSGKATAGAVRSLGDFVEKSAKAGPLAEYLPFTRGIVGNAARDLVDIPSSVIPSLYVPARDIASGHPEKAAQMLAQPFIDTALHPVRSFKEHPLGTALIVRGGYGAIDRGAGMGLRASPSARMRQLGSVERPARDVSVPGTKLHESGRYAKGAITKAFQAANDRRHGYVEHVDNPTGKDFEMPASLDVPKQAPGVHSKIGPKGGVEYWHHDQSGKANGYLYVSHGRRPGRMVYVDPSARRQGVATKLYKAAEADGRKVRTRNEKTPQGKAFTRAYKASGKRSGIMSDKQISTRTTETVASNEDLRRFHRGETNDAFKTAMGGTKPTAATSLIAQNITHPSHKALTEYRDQLKLEHAELSKSPHNAAKVKQNEQTQKDIESALKKFDHEDQAAAARRYSELSLKQQKELEKYGILGPEQAEARLTPYAVQHMGAEMRDGKLHDPHGVELTAEDIRAHMAHHGFEEPAFISQRPNARGSKNFYVARPQSINSPTRTGAATREGTADFHPDTMLQQVVRNQGLLDAHHGFTRFLNEMSLRGEGGKQRIFATRRQADGAAEEYMARHPEAPPVRAVRASPLGASKKQTESLLHDEDALGTHISDQLQGALRGEGDKGPWVLVPDAAARTFEEHLKGAGVHPALTKFNSLWRTNVLAFSPKWLTSNVSEAALRAAVAGAGPRSWLMAHRALARLEKIDPAAAEQARARIVGGGHYSLAMRNSVHSPAERFAGTFLAGAAQKADAFWRRPTPAKAADLFHAYTHFVFNTMNGKIESQFQTAMLGKALRQDPIMSEHFLKTSKTAVEQAAKGLRGTEAQVRMGREVDRMYGKYSKFSPGLRKWIANYTPFLAWSLNSLQFIFSVLPKDHPVITSLIASSNIATEDWRKAHGLKVDPFKISEGEVPGFLRNTIPTAEGGHVMAGRGTPFGITSAEGGLLGNLGSTFVPQASDIVANAQGKDWKGAGLAGRGKGSPDARNAAAVLISLLESTIPGTSQAATISGVHLPNEADGTKHPATLGERALKYVTPIPTVKAQADKKKTTRRKKGKSGVQFGGKSAGGVHFGGSSSSGVKFGG